MRNFFKIFLASLLALVVFSVIVFFFMVGAVSGLTAKEPATVGNKAVLVIDLGQDFSEVPDESAISQLTDPEQYERPSLYDLVRLIHHAKNDSAVKGIYLKADGNANGFAASEDIRNALIEFRSGGKFIYSYGEVIPQNAYHVANVSTKIYCNPKGGVDWKGFAMQLVFLKGTLDKLEIQPQVFYAGKFKSATEPFRATEMTEPNRIQSTELLNDLYGHFLYQTSKERKIDSATLHRYANEQMIRFAEDALKYRLVDGLKYDDQVKDEIKARLKLGKYDKINFVNADKYAAAVDFEQKGKERIAVLYASGDIIDGKGQEGQIGSQNYVNMIRKLRLDDKIKAIVLRINSGGGSSLASENILRELMLAKKEKPLVVSFGDYAASGAYYLSCNADSIFAQPNTITGSIGVFTLIPNMQGFFNDKLGMTFDGVKTAEPADAMTVTRPLSEMQKRYIQESVDSIYQDFLGRVAAGRKMSRSGVDSIAQGRVWSGNTALKIGLVDRIGGLQDAINTAAKMAKLNTYRLREYPEPQSFIQKLFGGYKEEMKEEAIKEEMGAQGFKYYQTVSRVMKMMNVTQARMPFDLTIE